MNSITKPSATRLLSLLLIMPILACDTEDEFDRDSELSAQAADAELEAPPLEILPLKAPPAPSMSSVDLSVENEIFHYYYLHFDYYNFYQIILSYGCSQDEVVFWWGGANQGHTGEANVDRFIDRLDTIAAANDIPSSYASYAGNLSTFFTNVKNLLNNCAV